jgi:predicted transcriptional regulator
MACSPAVLNLIKAHAILHQASRDRDDQGRIVATVDDYAIVRELVADLVAEGIDATVSATVRATVEAVRKLVDEVDGDPVSLGPIAKKLRLDKSAASRRLRIAISKGYVKNLEDRKGKPGRYVIGEPMPDDVVVLPTKEEVVQVLQCCTVAAGDKHPPSPSDDPGVDF